MKFFNCAAILASFALSSSAFANVNEQAHAGVIEIATGQGFVQATVEAEELKAKQLLQQQVMGQVARIVTESNLASGFTEMTFAKMLTVAKNNPAFEGRISRFSQSMTAIAPLLSGLALSYHLATGDDSSGTLAWRFVADSLLSLWGLSQKMAPQLWAIGLIDYSVFLFAETASTEYERYWFRVYAFHNLEYQPIGIEGLAEQLIDLRNMGARYGASPKDPSFAPWNQPAFVRHTDSFWSNASEIQGIYMGSRPGTHLPLARDASANARFREDFRKKLYVTVLHGKLRAFLKERIDQAARENAEKAALILEGMARSFAEEHRRDQAGLPPAPAPQPPAPPAPPAPVKPPQLDEIRYAVALVPAGQTGGSSYNTYIVVPLHSRLHQNGRLSANTLTRMHGQCVGHSEELFLRFEVLPATISEDAESAAAAFARSRPLRDGRWIGLGCSTYMFKLDGQSTLTSVDRAIREAAEGGQRRR